MPENYLPEEAVEILEEQFKRDNYVRGEELMRQLVNATGLEEGQISSWFARRRRRITMAKLRDDLERANKTIDELKALLNAKDAEIESLRDQTAALRQQIASLTPTDMGELDGGAGFQEELEAEQTAPWDRFLMSISAGEPSQLGL